jgi:hypothetical protein
MWGVMANAALRCTTAFAGHHGMWRSLVAHLLWEQGVGSSNLPIPTTTSDAEGLSRCLVAGRTWAWETADVPCLGGGL